MMCRQVIQALSPIFDLVVLDHEGLWAGTRMFLKSIFYPLSIGDTFGEQFQLNRCEFQYFAQYMFTNLMNYGMSGATPSSEFEGHSELKKIADKHIKTQGFRRPRD